MAVLQAQRAELEEERERLQAALAQRQTAAAVQRAPDASVGALLEAVRAACFHHDVSISCSHSPVVSLSPHLPGASVGALLEAVRADHFHCSVAHRAHSALWWL